MKQTAIIYGSSLGNTAHVAGMLWKMIPGTKLFQASMVTPEIVAHHPNLILGTSTWGSGMLQDDFEPFMEMVADENIEGKTIALFGLGDQQNYPDTFCDAMGLLYELLQPMGVRFIGNWPADGYDFTASRALKGEAFVGLAIDENNEPDLTKYRLSKWVEIISPLL